MGPFPNLTLADRSQPGGLGVLGAFWRVLPSKVHARYAAVKNRPLHPASVFSRGHPLPPLDGGVGRTDVVLWTAIESGCGDDGEALDEAVAGGGCCGGVRGHVARV